MPEPNEHDEARLDERVRAAYRAPGASDDAARARTLARLAGTRGLHWLFAADAFRARPVWVFAGFLLALAGGAWLGARFTAPRRAPARTQASMAAATSPVTFVLRAPGATRVSVVGDFNNWDAEATPMAHSGSGDLWILNVQLPRGVHLYSFVLDGSEWRPDPSAPLAADGSSGGQNSVIVVDGAKGL